MRTHIVVLCFALLSSAVASTAAAQPARDASFIVEVRAETSRPSVAPHLADDDMELSAPDAGDYALPIVGVVLGGAATITGLVGMLGSGFVLAFHRDGTPTNADAWLGGSVALAVVGAISLGLSIAELRNLHHRANAAEERETGPQVLQFTPIASGGVVSVAGTF